MRVLAISAHPDDETLGCGGTLLKHRDRGDDLFWTVVTQAYEPRWPPEIVHQKAMEIEQVAEAYSFKKCFKLGLPSAQLETVPQAELMSSLRDAIKSATPETVYLVHGGDIHSDHRAVFDAVAAVLKPIHMGALGVRRLLCYETLSSTEAAPPGGHRVFMPNVFNDITQYMDRKIEIMGLYQTEVQEDPLPRGPSSIRALARHRGATTGLEYVEAFMLIRELV